MSPSLLRAAEKARAEREQEWNTPKATPLMLAYAAAGDAREAFPHLADDETAEFAHRAASAGYVEATMAQEA